MGQRDDMLNSDQIQRELTAIETFDILFLETSKRDPDEVVGFLFRQLRKRELLRLESNSAKKLLSSGL
jgi:hypothetical protein